MCIILSCRPGARPTDEVVEECWLNNPDGAGIMYPEGGMVVGHKGLMTLGALREAMSSVPEDAPLVVHFRIGTSGGLTPEVTHPYPVSRELSALHATDWEAPLGIAHNGVLLDMPTDEANGMSDTVAYVRDVVWPLSRRKHGNLTHSSKAKAVLKRTSEGSRLAVMGSDGSVTLTGAGWNSVAKGIQASNGTWRPWRPRRGRVRNALAWLPDGCVGCPMSYECDDAAFVPLCLDVAESLGYSRADVDEAWESSGLLKVGSWA